MISMKRSVKVIAKAMIMMSCASVAAVSCDTYDDSEIWETIKELQEKIEALEQQVADNVAAEDQVVFIRCRDRKSHHHPS